MCRRQPGRTGATAGISAGLANRAICPSRRRPWAAYARSARGTRASPRRNSGAPKLTASASPRAGVRLRGPLLERDVELARLAGALDLDADAIAGLPVLD